MSGLAVAVASERARPTTGSDKAWKQRFAQPPSAERTFTPDDEITVSSEIYSTNSKTIVATTRIERESGEVVFGHTETLTPGGATPATFRHETGVALSGMEPGRYVLTVEAANRLHPASPFRGEYRSPCVLVEPDRRS